MAETTPVRTSSHWMAGPGHSVTIRYGPETKTGGNWEYIRFHIPTFIGQSMSGNPNIGSDMDGIHGGAPIIATRDYQWKSFAPQMLDMDGWGTYAKMPYAHGDPYTGISRMYLKLKAQLMPYINTISHEGTAAGGLPMIRAMFLEEENEYTLGTATQYQYMFGDNFLVAPIYQDTAADEDAMISVTISICRARAMYGSTTHWRTVSRRTDPELL